MAGKREATHQGRKEDPNEGYQEENDAPKQATAAQMAARKIKSVRGRRPGQSMAASTNTGVTQFSQTPVVNFGASAPAQGMFGGGSTSNSFPQPQPNSSSNLFGSGSFPAFGASSQAPAFNPPVPSSGFNFSAGGSNPFAPAAAAAAPPPPNGAPTTAFNGSIFNFGAASTTPQPQQPAGALWGSNMEMSDAPVASQSNIFGATSGNTSASLFTSGAPSLFTPAPTVASVVPNLPPAPKTDHDTSSPTKATPEQPAAPAAVAPSFNPFAALPQQKAATPFAQAPAATPTATSAPPAATSQPPPTAPSFSFFSSPAKESTPAPAPEVAPQPQPEKSNPFARLSVPQPAPALPSPSPSPSLFAPSQQSLPSPQPAQKAELPTPASTMPKFTTERPPQQQLKAFAAQTDTQNSTVTDTAVRIVELYQRLSFINEIFKEHVTTLPGHADWAPLLNWQAKQTTELVNQITALKKERAAAKGVTSQESSIFTKSKTDNSTSAQDESTTPKKPRAADTATSSGFSFFSQTPQAAPTANAQPQASTNMFGSTFKTTGAASNTPTNAQPQASNPFGNSFKPASDNASGSAVPATPSQNSPFNVTPFGNTATKNDTLKHDNKTTGFGSSFSTSVSQSGFQPTVATAPSSNNFMSQFAKAAKSVEELAAERKKKAMEEDLDSDDDAEEWSREYDEKEAARLAKEKQEAQAFSGFKPSSGAVATSTKSPFAPSSTPFGTKTSSTSGFKPSTNVSSDKPITSPAPSLFGLAPTPSTGTSSVPKTAFAPSTNFSGASSLFAAKPSTEVSADTSKSLFATSASAAATPSFMFNKPSADTSAASSKSPFSFSSAAPGASSPFGSRVASPAPSVFESLNAAPSPASNPFGHLSSGPSSNGQEGSSEEDHDEDESQGHKSPNTLHVAPKRKQSTSESDSETLEESMRRKKPASGSNTPTPSLLARMTHADGSKVTDADIKNRLTAPLTPSFSGIGQSSGSVFKPFDFGNPANTAPPKTQGFAGDQTYKFGTPLKFGTPGPNATAPTPTFNFQQASPSPAADSTPKPSLFKGLNTPAFGSAGSSALSSRATTPVSDTTEQGSTADNDEDEGNKGPQLDLADLTEDEKAEYDVLFHTDVAIAKKQDAEKQWATVARGPVWILLSKDTQRAVVRMRIASGATPLNYNILPDIAAKVAGTSGKQVIAAMPDDGRIASLCLAVRARNVAEDFCNAYNQYT